MSSLSAEQVVALHKEYTMWVNAWIDQNWNYEAIFYKPVQKVSGQPIPGPSVVDNLPVPYSNPTNDKEKKYEEGVSAQLVIMKLSDPRLAGVDQSGNVFQDETKEEHEPRIVFSKTYLPYKSVIEYSFPDRNVKTGVYEAKSEKMLCLKAEPWGEKPNIQVIYSFIPFFSEIITEAG